MPGLFLSVRREERAETLYAAAVLLLVMLAHAILETSRDALFLANIPARRLPWVYLGIAALALPGARLFGRHHGARSAHVGLMAAQVAAALGTLSFVFLSRRAHPFFFYALYIWGGLASTLIVVRFWLLINDRYTASQAKRVFPLIASGAVLGTVIGFGLTSLLGRRIAPHDLLALSAGTFLLSAVASIVWRRTTAASSEQRPEPSSGDEVGFIESIRIATEHSYVRRLALVLLLSSVTATLGDFVFKTIVANELSHWRMSSFLATTYFTFNAVALAWLWLGVTPFVRAIGVVLALALQPALLIVGGIWVIGTVSLSAAVGLRAIDGSLRWSLSKTATELLFVPMPARVRNAVKALSDIVAHRGGQALASLLILALLSTSDSPRWIAVAIVICAGAWVAAAVALRQQYVDLFRSALAEGSIQTRLDFPDLDVASLETLIAALGSPDDTRVIAALDLLRAKHRLHLVPVLILYHPSAPVVAHALELFKDTRRQDALPIITRLYHHADAAVRCAAVRARAVIAPDADDLRTARASGCAVVSATATAALAGRGWLQADEAKADLMRALASSEHDVRLCIAQALCDQPVPALTPLLIDLAHDDDARVRSAAVHAMAAVRDAHLAPEFIACLSDRATREPARDGLVALGASALDALARALEDHTLPRATRAHVPRTISRFEEQRAADVLLAQLLIETEGMVRYKILRGLGRMVARNPDLSLDPAILDQVITAHLHGILQLLHWRLVLEEAATDRPEWRTSGFALITSLMRHKETLAIERLFRVLGLRYRGEDLAQIYSGLSGNDPNTRSSSRELLEHVLSGDLRTAVLGLTDELPDTQRLAAGHAFYQPASEPPEALLVTLRQVPSVSLSCLAEFYTTQLGLALERDAATSEAPEPRRERPRDRWSHLFTPRAASPSAAIAGVR